MKKKTALVALHYLVGMDKSYCSQSPSLVALLRAERVGVDMRLSNWPLYLILGGLQVIFGRLAASRYHPLVFKTTYDQRGFLVKQPLSNYMLLILSIF